MTAANEPPSAYALNSLAMFAVVSDRPDDVLTWHLPVLVVMTALAAYFIHTGRLRRWQGLVLLALYIAYWVVSFTVLGEAPVEAA